MLLVVAVAAFVLTGAACQAVTDVVIETTDDPQAIVDANPAGTTYRFASGVHTGVQVVPKDGDTFLGADAGAILDGGGISGPAFTSNEVIKDVVIRNIEITNYAPTAYEAVIDAGSQEWGDTGTWRPDTNWLIQQVNIHDNGGAWQSAAIKVGGGTDVRQNVIANNAGVGVWGHGQNIIVRDNLVYGNSFNTSDPDAGIHSGGIKLVVAHDSQIQGNEVYDNQGPGIWCDASCDNVYITGNNIHDNEWAGIQYEISRGGYIAYNTVDNNGFGDFRQWLWQAGIVVSNSWETTVENNTVTNSAGGINVIDQRTRRNDAGGQLGEIPEFGWIRDSAGNVDYWRSENVTIANNTIDSSGRTGASNGGDYIPDFPPGQTVPVPESLNSNLYATTTYTGNTYINNTGFYWGTGDTPAEWIDANAWAAIPQA